MSSQANLLTLGSLPKPVREGIEAFVAAAQSSLGDSLSSIVLFGSAAEGRLRPTSDVNLILVLRTFLPDRLAAVQPALSFAKAAIRLEAMILLLEELPAAADCFAQKFADIERRRMVLHGDDPFALIVVPDEAKRQRTRQVLLNLTLRLRSRYALSATQGEQLQATVVSAIGPLRTCAASVLDIERAAVATPKEAFARLLELLGNPDWNYLPEFLSALREGRAADNREISLVLVHIHDLTRAMRARLEARPTPL
ncbi:MAG: nucleotidyltransferase domain-containing protein [Acidobacteria bacterium]|nr:nucleotidyltransferase domain-containing protein [Acidobacteriota bacterium]